MKRFALYVAVVLTSFLVGFLPGYAYSYLSCRGGSEFMSQVAAVSQYETLALLQYKHADAVRGRAALLDLLSFLEQVERNRRPIMQNTIEFDRTLVYARLALLEQAAGNDELSRHYVRQVSDSLRKQPGKGVSEEAARKFIDRVRELDAKNEGEPFHRI